MAKIQVAKEFKVNDLLAEAVICLWAEKQHELIESLAKAARDANGIDGLSISTVAMLGKYLAALKAHWLIWPQSANPARHGRSCSHYCRRALPVCSV
jgi:hypothetical protein